MHILSGSILAVVLSTLFFVGGHFLLSHPLRRTVVEAVGEPGFRGIYTAMAAIGLVWMIHAHATAPYVRLWADPIWARHLLMLIMVLAVLFLVLGVSTPSPGAVAGERVAMSYERGMGIHAITRHPGLWGFGLWAIGHLLANGDAATVILCCGIAVLAFGGMLAIDARKTAAFPEAYGAFRGHTSIVPFVALAQGRARLDWRRIGLARVAAALVVYVVLLFAHGLVIGLSALPV